MPIPKKLYKYRKFDVTTLNMVTDHGLYFANPRKFNDPLDCELSIEANISPRKLSDLLKFLLGPERKKHWHHEVGCAVHYASEEGDIKVRGKARDYLKRMLAESIGAEIRKELDTRGVLAFSATWQSVLMWSHYADEHRGICLEFDTSELPHKHLAAVRYDGERSIKASDIYAWKIGGDKEAGKRAFDMHFYSKAPDWKYEQEWRDIGDKPGECGDYRITGIYFGFRCDYAVKVAIVKMLGIKTNVDLFDLHLSPKSFELSRTRVDIDEIDALGMREPQGIETAQMIAQFDDLPVDIDDMEGAA
ncbi:hypothetical protein GCM10007897_23980 [Sphingobium jiangsuense]|uniref:DUF2971 domain-containing protein n=1 Tax=Sphingobium jiangsuense TaxID=870476 RepID=A0A7W6BVG9_9SPHN|nr:DUF2971 domain-containing protein [Sphingobium jiangsuense]MBB3928629.1 hypothetical protein [Sphingobium jiangsuense]GLT01007.1 hypothetical protein GCM10007897_23980 [Sphingobium jiangsuense]